MVFILFVVINGNVNFQKDFNKKIDCETALHNFKLNFNTVQGFCQQASK